MKNLSPKDEEFYVGYLSKAPQEMSYVIRKVITISFLLMAIVVSVMTWHEKKFSSSNFEYGINTQVEGYIFGEPIPHLLVPLGKDQYAQETYQTVLLVGEGKSGAHKILQQLKEQKGGKLNSLKITLNGYLIYGDGKALLQVNEENNREVKFQDDSISLPSEKYQEESITITGEIVDPKCYFGVMKPGEGKTHRSCAIRCIAGGIPPVFNAGPSDYYILVSSNNESMYPQILNLVGDHISLTGKAMKWNDWKIFKPDRENIRKLSNAKKRREVFVALEEGMTLCQ